MIPGSGVFEFDDVIVCRRPASSVDFNKILGLTDQTLCRLPEFERLFSEIDTKFVIEVAPYSLSPEGERHLAELGFGQHSDTIILHSDFDGVQKERASSLSIVDVRSADNFRMFLDVYQNGLGVPAELRGHPAFSHWWTLPGWRLFLAFEQDCPIAASALFIEHDLAYLATASTILAHRNKGAQSALIQHRIAEARKSKCTKLWAQTTTDSTSMRNMLRVGLVEFCRRKRLIKRTIELQPEIKQMGTDKEKTG